MAGHDFRKVDSLKILCISDVVKPELYDNFKPERFGAIDLLISCGDLPPEYLSFLTAAFRVPLYYVRGNHDIRYDSKPPEGCREIHGHIIQHGAVRILGLGGSRWYNGGPNQYTERQMRNLIWNMGPKLWWKRGVDMVVTHAPPRHIHDAEDLCHRGFKTYRRLIRRHQPAYFLHGHIHSHFAHDEQRRTIEGKTQVINCFGYYLLDIDDVQST
jgi:Icc-related predicted phosphoesterase